MEANQRIQVMDDHDLVLKQWWRQGIPHDFRNLHIRLMFTKYLIWWFPKMGGTPKSSI